MPELPTLRIRELFGSFQGEGARTGFPSVFVRLAGCSLKCSFCDTKESWNPDAADIQTVNVNEIAHRVGKLRERMPHSQVVITGGEPQEQNLYHLVRKLNEQAVFTAIETNGNHFQDLPLDWWTISPKPNSNYHIHPELAQRASEIKLVVNQELNREAVMIVREQVKTEIPIYLQPEVHDKHRYRKTYALFLQCQELGLKNIWCGVQLHKIYNVQ